MKSKSNVLFHRENYYRISNMTTIFQNIIIFFKLFDFYINRKKILAVFEETSKNNVSNESLPLKYF